jgi:predicted amidohydrolase YtcJ
METPRSVADGGHADLDGDADLVLVGAEVCTLAVARPWASAVAIRDGVIVRVGSDEEVRDLIGARTEVLPLEGSMVLPGFQDAHCHPASAGRDRLRIDLREHQDLPSYRSAIAGYARAHPDEPFLVGSGWSLDVFPSGTPSRHDLDDIVPRRPVFLMNRDGHGAWVNSAALALAGITGGTPDPWDGRIERDVAGEPTGTLHEGAATRFRDQFIAPPSDAECEAAILEAQRYLHSFGITALQDAAVSEQTLRSYRSLAERGQLRLSVVACLWWDRNQGLEQVENLLDQRKWGTFGPIDAGTVKIMVDGILENFTGALVEPYCNGHGDATENSGLLFLEHDELLGAVSRLDAAGFQVHMHAIGDRAVRESLDACEAAQIANGVRDSRHHIAHVQVIAPSDVPRFAALGVVANCQTFWACTSPQVMELTIPFLGDERAGWLYRFGDLHRAEAKLAFGSDWGVSTPNPLLELEVAVTRINPLRRGDDVLLPDQRLDLATAVEAFTLGSAYVNRRDACSGSLAAGKVADLAVLDRNLFDPAAGPIGDAQVDLTIVGGQVVFERS